ncbi:DUF4190 domain-containing protein [Actinoplanes sp. NPDC051411]|uniref:DUF4190 domain-containing protein n=1 Tax=Actinoplanes sp. NPDC051411 TaxID=3155522 RepID=UPI00342B5500
MPGYGYAMPPVYGTPPPTGYEMPAYGMPQAYYPYPIAMKRPYEGLAIASLVLSCAAVFGICTWGLGGLLGIVGAILGHVARARLKHNGRDGNGMALAGIIVGWSLAAISAAILIILVVSVTHSGGDTV